ncbi:hypothetical protein BE17_17360 [Sorangium cellulosum]|uniref:DUF4351 domain-containing protein n=1 Tax=Sorangium cellulosum TaxID=56 RepID=A0A150SJS8_SORCE|nr:hypothetical protein BE17_17360 [Sorangium cellulosum]
MGHPDQFIKRTFAEETALITGGAVEWRDPPEMRLIKVQGDGLLSVRRSDDLLTFCEPWPQVGGHEEILIELKMPGDHVDVLAAQRALLRRQARQVQRVEEREPRWLGEQPLWLVAPHLPGWLGRVRKLRRVAAGCYGVAPSPFSFLWIAANELPLRDELVPFLVARSGRPLDEFARWVATRRREEWVINMVQYTTMSTKVREEVLRDFPRTDDPEILRRRRHILKVLLEEWPEDAQQELLEQGIEAGRLVEARAVLRRLLTRRQLAPSADELARIEACGDLVTLERWLDQSLTAETAADALR